MRAETPIIQLFGQFSISCRGRVIQLGIAGMTRELLAYLLITPGKATRRDSVIEMLWEDMEFASARATLNTAVWRVNRVIRQFRGVTLVSTPEIIRLDATAETRIDTRLLETVMRAMPTDAKKPEQALSDAARADLTAAVLAYQGPFFDGCDNNWAIVEREKFTNLYLHALGFLMHDSIVQHDYEQALEYGRQILATDPFREQVQCEVMWLFVLVGQRVRALGQYKGYKALLERELSIQPMAETRALFELIQSARFCETPPQRMSGPHWDHPVRSVMTPIERSRQSGYQAARPLSS